MPPIDFSIVKAMVLFLILPGAGIAALGATFAVWFSKSEPRRSTLATTGLLLAMAAGIGLNKLVPFTEFETGWRSLFWGLALASFAEVLLSNLIRPLTNGSKTVEITTIFLVSILASLLSMPVEEYRTQSWLLGLLVVATGFDWLSLRDAATKPFGTLLPLSLSFVWGGSAAAVLVLSHSARFGELAVLTSCVLGGVGVVGFLSREKFESIYGGISALIPGLMLAGALNTYSNVPKACYLLIAVAPAMFGLLCFARLNSWSAKHPVLFAGLATAPCVLAVALAAKASLSAPAAF